MLNNGKAIDLKTTRQVHGEINWNSNLGTGDASRKIMRRRIGDRGGFGFWPISDDYKASYNRNRYHNEHAAEPFPAETKAPPLFISQYLNMISCPLGRWPCERSPRWLMMRFYFRCRSKTFPHVVVHTHRIA